MPTPKTKIKGITTPLGFRAAGGACGIKDGKTLDLALIVADQPCPAAGVFTRNQLPSPPVRIAKRHVRSGHAQAIVCSSGNANAATGKLGHSDATQICEHVAQQAGLDGDQRMLVLPCSTGVIGKPLPMDKIVPGIAALVPKLARGPAADAAAARAIMTTDLVPKHAYRPLNLPGSSKYRAHLAGIAKGSGMIAPNMATMLAFVTTDVCITPAMLADALVRAAATTFNRTSVDQHTSPSDSVLVMASGAAGNRVISRTGAAFDQFCAVLTEVCGDLAYQIVRDGEGATKVMRVHVIGARTHAAADRVARAVINSPLVKTALHGGDPNWGRITTAVGYSGTAIKPESLSLHISPLPTGQQVFPNANKLSPSGVCVFDHGTAVSLTDSAQGKLNSVMADREVVFTIDLGAGSAQTQWLGCDLSREYIAINADYTT